LTVGVLQNKNGSVPVYSSTGQVTVNSNSMLSFVQGDIVCTDPNHGGKVLDNGTAPCSSGTRFIGIVAKSDSSAPSHAIMLTLGPPQ
jgi:hypothetical protein